VLETLYSQTVRATSGAVDFLWEIFGCARIQKVQCMEKTSGLSSSESVSMDQVLRVAELAQLELTASEQAEMLRDLNSILGHVAQLNELDTAEVPAMAQGNEMLTAEKAGTREQAPGMHPPAPINEQVVRTDVDRVDDRLREDTLRASLDRKVVMAEAPETDGMYFKVPKVIER
jgi:aspartyl-tRNA(Asn)/glutamyl-tRNA(Gln) amidotransferase subunit C